MSDSIQDSKDALRDAEPLPSVKDQLQKELDSPKGVNINLDSASLGAAVETEESVKAVEATAVISDTSKNSDITEVKAQDALTAERGEGPASSLLGDGVASFLPTLTITRAEKEAFLKAVALDDRLELPFSIYGGNVKGVIRNRSLQEHNVLVAFLSGLVASKQVTTEDEYQQQLRALTLAAQIKQLGDKEFPILAAPLAPPEGRAAWMDAYEFWLRKDGNGVGVTRAVFKEVQKFEAKYWSMLQQSESENFWSTEEST